MITATIVPTGAGSETNILYYSPSANHWENVDTNDAGDFNWNPHDGAATRDLYAMGDTGITAGVIHRIRVYAGTTTWTGGSVSVSIKNSGGSTHDYSVTAGTLSYYTLTTNPDTSAAWTWAQLDAIEAGALIQGGSGVGNDITLYYVKIEIDYTVAPPSISKYNGIALEGGVSKINGTALASVSKVNGVS